MNLEGWKQGGKYFDYQNHAIFYRLSEKSDEVVLCLHGFPTSSRDYHKIWDALAARFPLLAYDLIGYGFSAKPADFSYTTFDQVDLLEALVENLKIKRVHVLAHDYGNTLTQELLARAGEGRLSFTVESVCMLNGALFPETHRPVLAQKILISPLGFLFGRLIPDARFKRSLASIFGARTRPSAEELDEFLAVFKAGGGRRVAHKLIRYMPERARYRDRWVGALEKMRQPFRFINGSADPVSGAHLVRRFREVVPHQTDIIELEGVGHYPHFEAPETVRKLFFEFHERI